jgi:hypothetical protein
LLFTPTQAQAEVKPTGKGLKKHGDIPRKKKRHLPQSRL